MSDNNGRYWLGKKRKQETIRKISNKLKNKGKRIKQIDIITGDIIKIFPSAKSASRELKCDPSSISKCARKNGINKTAYGYRWEYV